MCGIRDSLSRWGLTPQMPEEPGPVVLAEGHPETWVARWAGAILAGRPLLLLDHQLPDAQRREITAAFRAARLETPWILIPTGGSSGHRRWAKHTWSSLQSAAEGYCERFGTEASHAVSVLPLHHVAGMMPLVRAIVGEGQMAWGHYRELGHRLSLPPGASLSLVPTQLECLLKDPEAVTALRSAGRIFLGGAQADAALLATARAAALPLAPSYGMTESAAMVTALEPEAFLSGAKGVGCPLPHVHLEWGESVAFAPAPHGEVRRLGLRSPSLCAGYWPFGGSAGPGGVWWTSDAAVQLPEGGLDILGRLDRTIITGGENVDPVRVEALLRSLTGVRDAFVWGQLHPKWGEQVVAALEVDGRYQAASAKAAIDSGLSPAERPKVLLPLEALPRNDMGKLDRSKLALLVASRGLP